MKSFQSLHAFNNINKDYFGGIFVVYGWIQVKYFTIAENSINIYSRF